MKLTKKRLLISTATTTALVFAFIPTPSPESELYIPQPRMWGYFILKVLVIFILVLAAIGFITTLCQSLTCKK